MGGRSRQVQFARTPMVGRHFQKMEIGLSRGGRSRQYSVIPISGHTILDLSTHLRGPPCTQPLGSLVKKMS